MSKSKGSSGSSKSGGSSSGKTMLGGRYYTSEERTQAIQAAVRAAQAGQYKEAGQLKGGSVKEAVRNPKYKSSTAGTTNKKPIKVNSAQTLADIASETSSGSEKGGGKTEQQQEQQNFYGDQGKNQQQTSGFYGKQAEDELEEPNYKPDDGDVVWDKDPVTKNGEQATHKENAKKIDNEIDRLLNEKATTEGLSAEEASKYDRKIKALREQSQAEHKAAGDKTLGEKWEDLKYDPNNWTGEDEWAFLDRDQQTDNLAGGWGRQYIAGPVMTAGTGLQWFDQASDDMVRYEYDLEHGTGAYDRAIAGKNVNQIGQLGNKLWDTGTELQQTGEEMWAEGTKDMSDTGKQIANVAKTGMDVVGDIALNSVAPGMGTMRMYTGAAGNAAYEQSQREANDIDSRAVAAVKGGLSAYLSNKLVGGLDAAYGESILGRQVHEMLGKTSPEVQTVLKPLLNTEGIEEGLEDILNWGADQILGLDTGKPLDWNEVKQDAFVGYVLGVLTNGLAGGMNIDNKARQAIAQEAVEFAESGLSIEEAAEIGKQNTRDQVVLKATPESETNQQAETETDQRIDRAVQQAEEEQRTPEQNAVAETLLNPKGENGKLSNSQVNQILNNPDMYQAFLDVTELSDSDVRGATNSETRNNVKDAAAKFQEDEATRSEARERARAYRSSDTDAELQGIIDEVNGWTEPEAETTEAATEEQPSSNPEPVAPPEETVSEQPSPTATPEQETAETTATEANPEAEAPGNTNTQPEANTNENKGNTNEKPTEKKRKTDHTKKVTAPDENTDAAFEELNQKNGSIEKGENPARDINVPKKDTTGKKVGEGARTVFEADATPEERVASLKAAVVNGNFGHVPVSNDTRSKNAVTKLAKDGWTKSVSDFLAAVDNGKADADTIALGAHLLNEAGNSTECSGKQYIDLVMAYNDAVSDAGSRLAAGRILKTLTPEGKLYGMEKTVEKMNKKIRENNEKKKSGKQTAEIKLDENLVEDYLNAKADEERNEIHDKLVKDAAKQVPNTFRDKFTALRYLNMLGNFKTQVRNLAGNTGMTIVQKVKNEARGGIEGIVKAASGGKYDRQYKGGIGLAKRLKVASEDFVSDKDLQALAMGEKKFSDVAKQSEAEILDAKKPFSTKNPVGMFLNLYSDLTGKAMELGDLIFVRANYADALAGYLNAHDISAADWKAMVADPNKSAEVDKARAFAIKQAQEATFRDTNAVSKFASTFDSRWPGLAKKVSQGVIPFRKTPANVLMRMEEYSPLGAINTIVKGIQAAKGTAEVSDVIDSFAKSATGSGLAYLGYLLASMGMARTKDDDKNEESLAKLRGQQDYSVEVGGTSVTMDWLSPASAPFFMGVEAYNLAKDGNFRPADFFDVAMSLTNPMLEMSMLSGVNDALNNLSDFEGDNSAIAQFVLNSAWSYLTQGISNTLLGQMEQFSEENRQTYYTDKDNPLLPTWAQKKVAKLGNKTPGKDYQSADYIDAWGRKQANEENKAVRAWNTFLNPGYVSKTDEKATEVDALIAGLYEYGKDQTEHDTFPNVVPRTPSRYTTVNGTKLTPEEYDEYAITKGQESLNAIIEASQTEAFQNADEYTQAETIKDIYSYAEFLAAAKIAEERGEEYFDETYTPLIDGVKEDGENTYKTPIKEEDIPEYLAFKNSYDQAMKDKDYDAVDALIDSASSLPKSAQVAATERAKDMEKLADMKEAGLSSAEVYYQFTDDMKTIYEGEERTAPRASDYIKVAGSGKYSNKDADAIMNYERKVSKASLDRYQRQVKYQLGQAGKGGLNDEVWRRIELVANGKQDKEVFTNWIRNEAKDPKNRSGIPAKQGEEIIDIMTNYTSDNHVAGVYVTAFYNAARSIGCSPKQALQFYDHIDTNYNKSYSKSEIDKAVAWAFGYDSTYKKKYYGKTYTYYNFSGQAKKVREAIKRDTGR